MPSILVVDDERSVRDLLALTLADLGDVRTAEDGPAALAAASDLVPDVVVLDLMLPGMDGLEVLRRLRADDATTGVGVILLTARDERPVEAAAYDAGADAFLAKPFDGGVLEVLVTTLLTDRATAHADALAELRRLGGG